MKLFSKEKLKESLSDIKNYIYIFPVVFPILILYPILSNFDLAEFPYDNVRYAYSAIFQGFAALLAIMITAILITFQNVHHQRFSIEERIYKILGNRYPEYIPKSIEETEKDVRSKEFEEDFLIYLKNKEISITSKFSPPFFEESLSPESLVRIITSELRRKFDFLEQQRWQENRLRRIFIISLGVSIVVIIYSLSALILVPANPTETVSIVNGTMTLQGNLDEILQSPLFKINPIYALIIAMFLTLLALMVVMQLMMSILNIWKLKAD